MTDEASLLEHLLQDRTFLRRVLLVSGQGNVLQIGKYNIHIGQGQNLHIGDHIYQGPDVETLRQVMREVQAEIASDRYAASLQEYFRSLRRYCAELPYLTLTDIRPPKNLDEVYVPLQARWRENEPLPRRPAAQGASLTVEQVLRQAQTSHLLILGQPGAGKSTLLRQLAERAYDAPHAIGLDRPHLPLLLPLRALAHAEGALEARLNQALQNELRLTRALPDGFLDAWPQQLDTPWLFLLDGLDEVPANMYLSLRQWIGDLLAHPNIARVILTSRPSAYTEKEWESSRLSIYEIQPFTPDQTAELARRWFGEDASAFLQALETVRSSVLTETPLLITIAAKVYLERKRLPERRAQLYQEFVDIWLDEARERGLRDELGADVLDLAQPSLAHLALAMTDHPDWTDEKSLIPVVAEYLNEQLNLKARAPAVAERFLRVMARRSGVFLKREEQYEWVHPTFREYFAALALNQQLESGKSFEEVLGDRALREEWARAIVALAEVCKQSDELVIWICNGAKWKQSENLLYLAYACSVSGAMIISDETQAVFADTLIFFLDIAEISNDFLIIALMDTWPFAADSLIKSLKNPNPLARYRAAITLRYKADARAIPLLVWALGDQVEAVRMTSAEALKNIGCPAIESLIDALDNSNELIRWHSILLLQQIGDLRAIERLITILRDPYKDIYTQNLAAHTVIDILNRENTLEPLVTALRDPDTKVRRFAIDVTAELLKIKNVRIIRPLLASMFHPNEDIRWRAEEAISLRVRYGADEPTIKSLIDALQDPDEVVRRGAAYILGEIREIRAVEALIATLYDLNSYVRECAAIALGKIGDPGAVESLIAALRDPDGGVRRYAAEALGKIGDTRALPELERVAQEDTGKTPWGASVADAAREAIARIRERMEKTD